MLEDMGTDLTSDEFYNQYIHEAREDETVTVRDIFLLYRSLVDRDGDEFTPQQQILMVQMAGINLGHALYHLDRRNLNEAWENIVFGSHWIYYLSGHLRTQKKSSSVDDSAVERLALAHAETIISERAQKAALKGHEANHAMRDEAYAWLNDHFVQDKLTIDRAAEELKKIVPVEFSTRKGYVKSWKKSR